MYILTKWFNKSFGRQYRWRYNLRKCKKLSKSEKEIFLCGLIHRTSRRYRCTLRLVLDSAHNAPTFYKSSRKILFLVDASCCILIRAMPNERKWLSAFFPFFCLYFFFISLVRFRNKKYTHHVVIGKICEKLVNIQLTERRSIDYCMYDVRWLKIKVLQVFNILIFDVKIDRLNIITYI